MSDKTVLGKEINFNKAPVCWQGLEVYPGNGADSNLYGTLNVIKHPQEPNTPDINTDGNVNVKKDVNVEQDVNVEKNINVGGTVTADEDINVGGTVTAEEVSASGITLTSRKPFDIPHPTKSGYRLRHVCLEGPESGVYYRGRLKNESVINLPDYWEGLVDPETITATLTQIGSSQDLIVDKIEGIKRVIIKSGNASVIDCYFMINGEREDGEKLIVEYEGISSDDYPGDNSIYSINK
jgi:hypothetical protein